MRHRSRLIAPVLGVALILGACGGDDVSDDTDDTADTATTDGAGETYEVTAVDYAFEGLPATMPAGSTLTLTNASDVEAHELVAIRIPDIEVRSVEDLIQLPDEELSTIFPEDAPPAVVLIAGPGEEGIAVVGDGTISEPGRYAIVCFFPTGGDPEEILDPDATGPPDVENLGPPHAFNGMYAELTVE